MSIQSIIDEFANRITEGENKIADYKEKITNLQNLLVLEEAKVKQAKQAKDSIETIYRRK